MGYPWEFHSSSFALAISLLRTFETVTFSFRIQKFRRPHVSVFKSKLPVHTYLARIWQYLGLLGECWQQRMRRGCHLEYRIHGKEQGFILARHRIKKISGFSVHSIPDSQRIQKFPLWRADSKSCGFVCRIHRIRVDGSRIRKGKVEDSKISGYVWSRPAFRSAVSLLPVCQVATWTSYKSTPRVF